MTGPLGSRSHCTCVVVRNYDYDEAASKLKIKADWLRDHISGLPHMKFGHNAAVFCDCDLRLIQAMNTVLPPRAAALLTPPEASSATPADPAYAALRPSKGRKRQTAGV
ncbi:hypothetical protein ACIP2X_18635 [Streptomyces sp. NPDC089424]|uniref:hypothetical protein n=1 Tax=Streptomyces sp. NPDC089424 TaxID=3365917 RepID=UPI0038188566